MDNINYKQVSLNNFKKGISHLHTECDYNGEVIIESIQHNTMHIKVKLPENIENVNIGFLYSRGWPKIENGICYLEILEAS